MSTAKTAEVAVTQPLNARKSYIHQGIASSLTVSQSAELEKLLSRCKEDGIAAWPQGLDRTETPAGISDEVTLLRFLRARNFDVDGAYTQYLASIRLRDQNEMISVYNSIDVTEYDEAKKLYPHWTGRCDKRGLPICFFDIGHLKVTDLAKYNTTQKARNSQSAPPQTIRALAVHDELTRFVLPLSSSLPDRPDPSVPISSCLYLVDISALSFKWAWNAKSWVQDISKLLATSYPELLDKVFVIGAPSLFPRVWPLIKPWVDPVTAGKIQFLASKEVLPTMKAYVHVKNIPKRYGGELECVHGMQPDLDEEAKALLDWTDPTAMSFPAGPLKWVADAEGRQTIVSCGTVDGKQRGLKVATLRTGANAALI